MLPGCRGLTRGSFGSFWLNSSQHNVYVTRRSSLPLPLPAFSIIREITHFPSNLIPQNSRKRARAYLAKFRARDIRRNARFNIQRNAFDSSRARRRCELVRICVRDFETNTRRRQTMLMRRLSPLYRFLASWFSLCSPLGLLIPQGIQSPNARIRLARVTRRATRISSWNQAEGIFPSKEIAIFVGDVGI